jgi:nucleoside-diphosphate-sugar epimerase
MKIFVTGGSGFIGSHFINHAHSKGITVVALRRKNSESRVSFNKDPIWVEGQIDDFDTDCIKDCDTVVHFAAHTPNPPYDSYGNCFYWNVVATLNLFDKAKNIGVRNFLVAGTCFEYGKSGERYKYIPTTAPLEPTSSYPASKAAASIALSAWSTENNTKLKILRIFQVYGEGELKSRLWPSLKIAASKGMDIEMTSGDQVRDFISVHDVADKFIEELNFSNLENQPYLIKNIGSGKPQSIRNFSEFWWEKWGAKGKLKFGKLPYRNGEVMRYVPEV